MTAGTAMSGAGLRLTVRTPADPIRLLKFVTQFAVGGTERQVMTLAGGLDPARFALHLACLRRSGELLDQRAILQSAPPVEYRITNLYNRRAFGERLKFAAYLRRHRIQIVHTYSFYPNVFAIAAARLARTPLVIASIRDMGVYQTPLQLRVQREMCRLAHRIVVNAVAVERWLVANGYDAGKITVIPNGVEMPRFSQPTDGAKLRHDLGLPEGCPLVAVVSRLSPSKGIEDFLRAAAVVTATRPETRFLIVGQPAPFELAYRDTLAALAARLGLEGRVVFTGLRLDVAEILSQVAVSVLPSLSEGLSNVLLESMAAGVPVIATRVGGNTEAVEHGVTGLIVPPSDPEAIAHAMDRLLGDLALARQFGQAGHQRVVERFGMDTAIRETQRLYDALLAERSPRPAFRGLGGMSIGLVAAAPRVASPPRVAATLAPEAAPPGVYGPVKPRVPGSVRGLAKTVVARALSWSRADALLGRLSDTGPTPVVLGYHRVVEDFDAAARVAIPAMLTSRAMLEAELDWIGRRYTFVSLDELGDEMGRGRASSRPIAAVTFDDGYRDVYEEAFPVLQKKGIPSAVFVVTDLVGTNEVQIHDRLYMLVCRVFEQRVEPGRALAQLLADLRIAVPGIQYPDRFAASPLSVVATLLRSLARSEVDRIAAAIEHEVGVDADAASAMQPLDWDMLARMSQAGMVIGSHTRTHAWLTQECPAEVLEEARGSRAAIATRLGITPDHFAYPDGRFDRATVTAVSAAGYRFGYTTCTHRDPRHPLLTVPRRMLWEHSCVDAVNQFSPAIMSCQMHGVFDLVNGCEQAHGR